MDSNMQSYMCLKCNWSWYGILTQCPNPECDGRVCDVRKLHDVEPVRIGR